MNTRINSVLVLGLGKVGYLVALLLDETGFRVTGADLKPGRSFPFSIQALDVTSAPELTSAIKDHDAVISCMPYHFNVGIAGVAAHCGVHYFDLTEDVNTTRQIIEMSKISPSVMAPQCGLAPGFIGNRRGLPCREIRQNQIH